MNESEFSALVEAVAGGAAGPVPVAALREELRRSPERLGEFLEQIGIDTLLREREQIAGGRQRAFRPARRWARILGAAAALAVLLGGIAYAYRALTAVTPAPAPAIPEPVAVSAAEPDAAVETNTASTAAAIPAAVREETQGESTVKTNRPAREAIAAVALVAAVSAVQATAPLSAEAYQPVGSGDSGASVLDTRTGTGAVAGEIPIDARTGTELDSAAGPLNTAEIKGTIYSFR